MFSALVAALAGVILFLGKQLIDARAEATELRSQVALLKRRLARAGN
jgi:hypothetical protein